LLAHLVLVAGLPVAWLWQVPVLRAGGWGSLRRTVVLLMGAAALLVLVVLGMYRDLAPVVRNNMALRFAFNPLSPVLSMADVLVKPLLRQPRPFVSIAGGAQLDAAYAGAARPALLVLVVGETARADHFGLNGYARDTTPELARRDVLSWRHVQSCGTSTLHSVPCMFSHLGHTAFERRVADYDNLLDVLQQAGLAVLWLDNQAGCKGVCDRVAHASTEDAAHSVAGEGLCTDGECLDDLLLEGLDERIAQLPKERRQRGVVLVMHQMGSHGPAYYKRSTPETKAFQPECATNALASCAQEALVNVYDNSIRHTDRFLAHTLDWLRARSQHYDPGFLYLSDHGESLGEMGLYLHGMPYAVAPMAQKHVPMVAWAGPLGARSGVDVECLGGTLNAELTHDNLYHTVLGLMGVRSATYQSALDAFATCRKNESKAGSALAG
jgi:lipid A ethanolaminephosphotransferase